MWYMNYIERGGFVIDEHVFLSTVIVFIIVVQRQFD